MGVASLTVIRDPQDRVWIYRPWRADILGNKRVDSLASKTSITGTLKVGGTDKLQAMRDIALMSDVAIEGAVPSPLLGSVIK